MIAIDHSRACIISSDHAGEGVGMAPVLVHQNAQVMCPGIDILLWNVRVGAKFFGGTGHQLHKAERTLRRDGVVVEIRFRGYDTLHESRGDPMPLGGRTDQSVGVHSASGRTRGHRTYSEKFLRFSECQVKRHESDVGKRGKPIRKKRPNHYKCGYDKFHSFVPVISFIESDEHTDESSITIVQRKGTLSVRSL